MLGGCILWIDMMSSYTAKAYKPDYEVAENDEEILRGRSSRFPLDGVELALEWFTYDNEIINQPPYKLYVWVRFQDPEVREVRLESITINSSLNETYIIQDLVNGPVVFKLDSIGYKILQPAFSFDFDNGEEITTFINYTIEKSEETIQSTLETRWIPYTQHLNAPIV